MVKTIDKKLHKLKYWRELVGLKQDDLALLIGCKRSNYSQKENRKVEIGLTELLKIQKAINTRLVKMGKPEITLDEMLK